MVSLSKAVVAYSLMDYIIRDSSARGLETEEEHSIGFPARCRLFQCAEVLVQPKFHWQGEDVGARQDLFANVVLSDATTSFNCRMRENGVMTMLAETSLVTVSWAIDSQRNAKTLWRIQSAHPLEWRYTFPSRSWPFDTVMVKIVLACWRSYLVQLMASLLKAVSGRFRTLVSGFCFQKEHS